MSQNGPTQFKNLAALLQDFYSVTDYFESLSNEGLNSLKCKAKIEDVSNHDKIRKINGRSSKQRNSMEEGALKNFGKLKKTTLVQPSATIL